MTAGALAAIVMPKCGLCLLVYAGLIAKPGLELCGGSATAVPLAWKGTMVACSIIAIGWAVGFRKPELPDGKQEQILTPK